MRVVRITPRERMRIPFALGEELYIRLRLRQAGFDPKRAFGVMRDPKTHDLVFSQSPETKGDVQART